jgi:hypothetical protein
MILVPETPITENSFEKWKCHKMEVTEEDGINFHYWVIPLIEMDESEIENIEFIPSIYSSASDELEDDIGNPLYTMKVFEEDLPALTSEEEVELLYFLITKKDLLLKN